MSENHHAAERGFAETAPCQFRRNRVLERAEWQQRFGEGQLKRAPSMAAIRRL